jgi:hypothetical protein
MPGLSFQIESVNKPNVSSLFISVATKEAEFQTNMGKCIDVLRTDVPDKLVRPPDLSIFAANIKLSDPSGQILEGKPSYEGVHKMLRGISAVALRDSELSAKMVLDGPRDIKVKITAKLWLVWLFGIRSEPIYVDLVSCYHLNDNGLIDHHSVEFVDLKGDQKSLLIVRSIVQFMAKDLIDNPAKIRSHDKRSAAAYLSALVS